MALFLLCPNLGWIQGQFNFTELSLRYPSVSARYGLMDNIQEAFTLVATPSFPKDTTIVPPSKGCLHR